MSPAPGATSSPLSCAGVLGHNDPRRQPALPLDIYRLERFERGEDTSAKSNIAGHLQFKRGDLEQGFTEAAVIVEREFSTQTVHQGYIEPHASTASWAADGHLTLWTSTQGPFAIRTATAAILHIPESMVTVIPMEIGGGFGAKLVAYLDPVAALLSRKSGRPVKIVNTREEAVQAFQNRKQP